VREGTYRMLEIIAWLTAVGGCIEVGVRADSGYGGGMLALLLVTASAAGTIGARRPRRAQCAARQW